MSLGSSHSPEVLTPSGKTVEDARYLYLSVALEEETLGGNRTILTERKIKIWCKKDLCLRDLRKVQLRKPKGRKFIRMNLLNYLLFLGAAAQRVKNTEEFNNRVIAGVRKRIATFTSSQLEDLMVLTETEKATRTRR